MEQKEKKQTREEPFVPIKQKLNSSRILSLKWEVYKKGKGILTLTFKGEKIYQYLDVPKSVATDLINAESAGKFFDAHINKKYQYRKYGEVEFHD